MPRQETGLFFEVPYNENVQDSSGHGTLSLREKRRGIVTPSVKRETLGFFQLAVAYGVDITVDRELEQAWLSRGRKGRRPNFYRDLHVTNRYLNTPEATQDAMVPYAGVGTSQSVQMIIRNTLNRLYENFPWDRFPDDIRKRYPREIVVHGKEKGFLTSKGHARVIEGAHSKKTPIARENARETAKALWSTDQYRQSMADGHRRFWHSPKSAEMRESARERITKWNDSPEGRRVLSAKRSDDTKRKIAEGNRRTWQQRKEE